MKRRKNMSVHNLFTMLGAFFICLTAFSLRADIDDFSSPGASISLSDATISGTGNFGDQHVGKVLIGDLDGDALSDVLVSGGHSRLAGSCGGNPNPLLEAPGEVYLVYGSSIINSGPDIDFTNADHAFTYAGAKSSPPVIAVADVDGDGLDDILISEENSGKTYLFFGGKVLAMPKNIDLSVDADFVFNGFVPAISNAGDVDGDGKQDLLMSDYNNSEAGLNKGKTFLILASTVLQNLPSGFMDFSNADYSFIPVSIEVKKSGWAISSAGDVDEDGKSDILINAQELFGSQTGITYLFLASSLGNPSQQNIPLENADFSFYGVESGEQSGYSISSAGDVDGDGKSDMLIGAPGKYSPSHIGKAYVILGKNLTQPGSYDLSVADYTFVGELTKDLAGISVSGGDVDEDGKSDILVGAPNWYKQISQFTYDTLGRAYLVLGKNVSMAGTYQLSNADYIFQGDQTFVSGDYTGLSVYAGKSKTGQMDVLIGRETYSQSSACPGTWKSPQEFFEGFAHLIHGYTICHSISISPQTLPQGIQSVSYSTSLTANGGTAPYTYSLVGGGMPPGISLSSDGTISGTPTSAGDYSFLVNATDKNGCFGVQLIKMSIIRFTVIGRVLSPWPYIYIYKGDPAPWGIPVNSTLYVQIDSSERLNVSVGSQPRNGTLKLMNSSRSGSVYEYQPRRKYIGTDSFGFRYVDATGTKRSLKINIDVTAKR